MASKQNRRSAIRNILTGTATLAAGSSVASFTTQKMGLSALALKGNINHSVCRWCYNNLSLDELCLQAKKIGIKGIDLIGPKDWAILKKHDLDSPMCNGAEISLTEGFNNKKYHETLVKNYTEMIPLVAKAGYKNLICFSGSRAGMDNETGWNNSVEGLKRVIGLAEKHNVVLVMELLNSKIDHKDYQCDRASWGGELAKRISSENFKLLFDIYHMQIDEGDIIRNINNYHQYIAHYHTGGVPGRNEIDDTQELYYPAVMRAIVKTGFKGYVAQEFVPTKKDKLTSLNEAVHICDV